MPYEILMFAIVGFTPVVTAAGAKKRTLLTMSARVALILAIALSATACGGNSESTTTPTPPTAPFSATDLREGTGTAASQGRTVTVSYTGWLFDPSKPESKGTQFDSQTSFTFQLGVGRVIAGWEQGIPGMKTGGQRRLVIPPNLGYGSQMVGAIPPNSTLVFDVMLLNVL
jgi:FKBP-type peptidyl-prolyl cis-trans isomerase FkpA